MVSSRQQKQGHHLLTHSMRAALPPPSQRPSWYPETAPAQSPGLYIVLIFTNKNIWMYLSCDFFQLYFISFLSCIFKRQFASFSNQMGIASQRKESNAHSPHHYMTFVGPHLFSLPPIQCQRHWIDSQTLNKTGSQPTRKLENVWQ